MNAFTQKPKLDDFFKKARHSAAASANGQQVVNNPSPEQRRFFADSLTHFDLREEKPCNQKR